MWLGHGSRTFVTHLCTSLPRHHFYAARASMAILLVCVAGLIIGILVLAIVALFYLLDGWQE